MAHVPLTSLGAPRDAFLDEASFRRHAEAMAEKNDLLRERRDAVANGWGEKYVERVHAKGKRTRVSAWRCSRTTTHRSARSAPSSTTGSSSASWRARPPAS